MPIWDIGVLAKARQIAIFAFAALPVAWRPAALAAACPKRIGKVSEKLWVSCLRLVGNGTISSKCHLRFVTQLDVARLIELHFHFLRDLTSVSDGRDDM